MQLEVLASVWNPDDSEFICTAKATTIYLKFENDFCPLYVSEPGA
jgi:hypothetical protein